MYTPHVAPYETFMPLPGVITYVTAVIVIALVLWAKRCDERDAKRALQDDENPKPPE